MNQKIGCQILIIIFTLAGIGHHMTYAKEWEDEDTPISFKIEMLPWEKVKEILPTKTKFTIIDVETGLKFRVQRRAGNQHADVQPLTKEDTKIMKKIYNGKWSWKRRAIIVSVNDQMIAASMNGMPHGAGALRNNFPGHFCIHFLGSVTHRSKNEDLSHKLMILKAAGKVDQYLDSVDPYELINVLNVSINQGDEYLLKLIFSDSNCPNCLDEILKNVTYFGIGNLPALRLKDTNELLFVEIPVQVNLYSKRRGNEKKKVHLILRRESLTDQWLIDQYSFYKDLKLKER